jgi:hypothetical protein
VVIDGRVQTRTLMVGLSTIPAEPVTRTQYLRSASVAGVS